MTTSEWGRVAEDGTVYVRTADGERPVGQYPEGSPEEALAFYAKRYDELAGSVHLLEQRVNAGVVSPDEATESVRNLRDPGGRGARRRRPHQPGRQARLAAPGDLPAATGPPCRARRTGRGDQDREGAAGRRGREARREQRLAQRREPAAAAARRVEGAAADRPRRRRRSCGGASRPRARRTPGAASRTSPSRTRSARAPGSSSSGWSRRPSRWRSRASGARPPAPTAS